jgi:hypothetical protein
MRGVASGFLWKVIGIVAALAVVAVLLIMIGNLMGIDPLDLLR